VSFAQIISQYTETNSGTTPKGIEIWNNTGSTLDFSTNNLVIEQGTNGGDPSATYTLSEGNLASGDVIVIGTSDMETTTTDNGSTFYLKAFNFNGDDALVVKYGGIITDVFGTPGNDPGSAWSGNGVSTADQNIALIEGITSGDTDGWLDPSLRFETISIDPFNNLSGFGISPPGNKATPSNHITNLSSSVGVPDISTIVLDWTDATGVVLPDGYLIKGSDIDLNSITDPVNGVPEDDDILIKNVPPGVETVTITDLNPSTTYYFKIFPFSNFGASILFKTDGSVPNISETTEAPKLIISEVTDPGDVYQARFVEIYNLGNSTVNFTEQVWYLSRQTNGGNWEDKQLIGSILPNRTYVSANYNTDNTDNFYLNFGYLADFHFGGGTIGNGDDGYFLFYGGDHSAGYLVDAFGVIDVDGTGQAWEYEDSRAVRKITVTEPNSTWTADEWDIASANVADCDPGYYRNSGGSNSQVVSSTGTVDFNSGLTAVEFVIATLTGSDDVVVSKFTNPPSNVSGIAESNFSQYRWLMEIGAGITDIDTELRFYLAAIPNHGIIEGDVGIRLYKRAVEGTGAFTLVGTFTYNDNGTVGDQSDDWLSIANVTSFSEFVFASDTSPLPVELTTFTANVFDGKVNLRWATATEVDNYGFEVQRSAFSNQRPANWKTIGFVEGHGNSNSPKNYEFTDSELPNCDAVSYRLKQIDIDGAYEYSNEIEVNLETIPAKFELSQNYPNPFNPVTKIQYSIPAVIASEAKQSVNATLKVYDIIGREVAVLVNEAKEAGIYEVEFDASKLSSGLYFYSLSTSGKTITKKMMLLR